ncbi:MAG: TIM barrel protein [Negativicutes bacterium]|nr:TIM barrel protein [Negativicutes bacterium]
MVINQFFKRSCALLVAAVFMIVLLSGASVYAAEKPIVMSKYPNLKIGFTSQNFSKWLPPTVPNLKIIMDYASQKGFAFIEIRDPAAKLSLSDCKELAAYAKQKNLEVVYAMGVGGLDDNYFEAFSRGLANAMVFDGPKYVRTGANGNEMNNDLKKQFWTSAEFTQLVSNLNQAANTAKTFGMTLLVENANEGLSGDGVNTFGTSDLFGPSGMNANVGLQLDMANFFCTSRVENSPTDVRKFFEANVTKMGYSHLKTSINHKPAQYLNGNELAFDVYFASLSKLGKVYVAIELANADNLEQAYANHEKSVDYLLKNF